MSEKGKSVFKRKDFSLEERTDSGEVIGGSERWYVILFNTNVISEDKVNELLRTGEYIHDQRIIVTTPAAADAFLKGIWPPV